MVGLERAASAAAAARSRPTMRHVAALAGVGVKTVSRVINGEPNVSPATTAKVRRLEDGLPEWRAAGLPVEMGAGR